MSTSLVYTVSAYTPFTKILSANINSDKSDIQSRINWAGGTSTTTGLGDDNVQSNTVSGGGLTRSTKLKSGTANYCVINDSSGNMTEEQYLATSRGGFGGNVAGSTIGDTVTWGGSSYAPGPPVPAGVLHPYVGTSAPTGYLMCDGSQVSRTTYARLFAVIGTTYGQGDSSTTFNVPDMRGMFARGASQWQSSTFTASSSSGLLITTTAGEVTRTGQQVQFSNSGGALPTGLSASTTYYTVYVSSTTFRVATTYANALAGTVVAYTDAGSGTNTVKNWLDPDLANRAQHTTGSTSTLENPGTWQNDATTDHTHSTSIQLYAVGNAVVSTPYVCSANNNSAGSGNPSFTSSGATRSSSNSQTTYTTETRPFNIAFNYIIKF